jgi:hypothetical protein
MGKVSGGTPATKYMSTLPSTISFASSAAEVDLSLRTQSASATFTASASGMGKESSGTPTITNLSTYESGAALTTASSTLLIQHPVSMTTTAAGFSLNTRNTNSTLTFDPDTFDPVAFITTGDVPYTSLQKLRILNTLTTYNPGAFEPGTFEPGTFELWTYTMGLDASAAILNHSDYETMLTAASGFTLTTSPTHLWHRKHRRVGHAGSHTVKVANNTTNLVRQGGVKDVSDAY